MYIRKVCPCPGAWCHGLAPGGRSWLIEGHFVVYTTMECSIISMLIYICTYIYIYMYTYMYTDIMNCYVYIYIHICTCVSAHVHVLNTILLFHARKPRSKRAIMRVHIHTDTHTHTLILFPNGTIVKYKFILFSPGLLKSPVSACLQECLFSKPEALNLQPTFGL